MNKMVRYICLLLLSLAGINPLMAQEEIKGVVIDAVTRHPVEGAYVLLGVHSAETDAKGAFTVRVDEKIFTLEVSKPGYYTAYILTIKGKPVHVNLQPEKTLLYNPVQVLPLATVPADQKRGSTRTLGQEQLLRTGATPDQALAGKFAPLRVLSKGGMPGEGAFVQKRGIRSFTATNNPLIVLDGMPYLPGESESRIITGSTRNIFMPISTKDVKNIAFVTGADAAIYGSLGANGVLLIETEQSSIRGTSVEFHTTDGIGFVPRAFPVMNRDAFVNYISDIGESRFSDLEALVGQFPFLRDDEDYQRKYRYIFGYDTDWQKEIYSPAITSENVLKIKGGDAIANYAFSVGYLYDRGVMDYTSFNKYYAKVNANISVTERLKLFASMNFDYNEGKLHEQGMKPQTNPGLAALYSAPVVGVYAKTLQGVPTGRYDAWGVTTFGVSNPVAAVDDILGTNQSQDILVDAGLTYKFNEHFSLNTMVGLYYDYLKESIFLPGKSSRAVAPTMDGIAENAVRKGVYENFNLYFKFGGDYSRQFNEQHAFSANAGMQLLTTRNEQDIAQGINTTSDFYKSLGSTTSFGRSLTGEIEGWNWLNFFARAGYDYREWLKISAALTVDGSTSSGERSGYFSLFPSAQIALKLNRLSGFSEATWLDNLTLRAEASVLGNSRFSPKLSRYYYSNKMFWELTGLVRAGLPNSQMKSERNTLYNAGLDFATGGHRLQLSVDASRETTDGMVLPNAIGPAYGFEYRYENAGKIRTDAVDVSLQYSLVRNDNVEWIVGGTLSAYNTIVEDLGEVNERQIEFSDGAVLLSRVGEKPYSFLGYRAEKVIASSTEAGAVQLRTHTDLPFEAGDMLFRNTNANDNVINASDRVILGNPQPDFYGGFFTHVRYKAWSLSANFTYSYGNEIYNVQRRGLESMTSFNNQTRAAERRWTYDGQETDMPRATYGDPKGNSRFSNRWIEDGSYVKLKNITLSYHHPGKYWFFHDARLYITGDNLWVATKYLGQDPEFAWSYDSSMLGIDQGKLPSTKTLQIGVQLQF
ncbi:MAG: SusC/RagA family TonB-linked outer membrane protein [Odoribacteraceae bacterium]|jgi:TonB-linked SusC/RagA family outer membrane protein|nr:SusC/RagA family TonB-linked outer membrane protein [Odoribacteraceae bacterium]